MMVCACVKLRGFLSALNADLLVIWLGNTPAKCAVCWLEFMRVDPIFAPSQKTFRAIPFFSAIVACRRTVLSVISSPEELLVEQMLGQSMCSLTYSCKYLDLKRQIGLAAI